MTKLNNRMQVTQKLNIQIKKHIGIKLIKKKNVDDGNTLRISLQIYAIHSSFKHCPLVAERKR